MFSMKSMKMIRYAAFWLCFSLQIVFWLWENVNLDTGMYDLLGKNDAAFLDWGQGLYYFIWLLLLIMPKWNSLFLVFLYVAVLYNDEILYLYVSAKDIDVQAIYISDYIGYSLQSYYWYFFERIFQEPLLCIGRMIKSGAVMLIMTIDTYLPIALVHVGLYVAKKIVKKYLDKF